MIKKVVGGIGALILVLIAISMFGSPDLELRASGQALSIKNKGTSPVKILDIQINNDDSCATFSIENLLFHFMVHGQRGAAQNIKETPPAANVLHSGWVFGFNDEVKAGNPVFNQAPKELRVGDTRVWNAQCNIVRAKIKTDQGSETYTF